MELERVSVIVCAKTDVGRARDTNEDAWSVTELASGDHIDALDADRSVEVGARGLLLALSDGMGGHQAGEVASALVLETLEVELAREAAGRIDEKIEEAVLRTNRVVHEAAKARDRHGMGATLTAVFIRGTQAYITEIGDSRGYVLRGGRLRQITRDQSLVQMLVDQGVMTPEEARNAPSRNVVLQAMGLAAEVRVAIGRLELRQGDRLLLCSDGITNEVTDEELRQIMTDSTPKEACETMIALANERGGGDNQTAIVADVVGDLAEPLDFESLTSTYVQLKSFQKGSTGTTDPPPLAPAPEVPQPVEPPPAEPPVRQSWIQSLRAKLSRRR